MDGWIYHEKQEAALCGVHTINNLLQGPYFTAVELMQIAQQLDAQEHSLMSELGETEEFIKFVAEDSGNVAEDGNFSIAVLKQALSTFSLFCIPITHPDVKEAAENPTREEGFLCNLQSHWFAIRKLGNSFWDLNSIREKPNLLGEVYLGAFLKQLQWEGYSIFVVRGDFPRVIRSPSDPNWTHQQPRRRPAEEDDLKAAIAASLNVGRGGGGGGYGGSLPPAEDDAMAAAINASLGVPLEDMDLEAALLLSMESPSATPHPPQPPNPKKEKYVPVELEPNSENVTNIIVRLPPNGKRVERKFDINGPLEHVYNWLYMDHDVDVDTGKHVLFSTHPKTEYKEATKSLKELGLTNNTVLITECTGE